jgi:hypothetical protein
MDSKGARPTPDAVRRFLCRFLKQYERGEVHRVFEFSAGLWTHEFFMERYLPPGWTLDDFVRAGSTAPYLAGLYRKHREVAERRRWRHMFLKAQEPITTPRPHPDLDMSWLPSEGDGGAG